MLQRVTNGPDGGVPASSSPHQPHLGAWAAIGPLVCLVLLICLGGASVWQARSNRQSLEAGRQTRSIMLLIQQVLSAVEDAETGQRGYLLTQDETYLAPYNAGVGRMPDLLDRLSRELRGDAELAAMSAAIQSKLAELTKTIGLVKDGHVADAVALVRTDLGQTEMNEIRGIAARMNTRLDTRLTGQVQAITESDRLLVLIQTAGLGMVGLLGGLMLVGLRSYLRTLQQARGQASAAYAELARSNDRLDEQVRVRTAELTAANDEIQRFAYIVSHDLRAPLVNIMGFTSELEQASTRVAQFVATTAAPPDVTEAMTDEIPEALRFIKTSTSKMDRLINAILRLSREGRRVLTAERLDMGAIFGSMVETMSHQATQSDARVEVSAVPNLVADRLAVEQIFGNLVENALKYLKPGRPGLIRITGRALNGVAQFDIADNGRGIAEKDFERVFELFRRAGDQTVPGEGIGLAHVRALVRRLGGSITCRSQLGVGTTFTVQLPLRAVYSREAVA